ncbi:L-histidine N(alpha)-methyltransferase [Frankia sp. CcWB3]
MTPRTPTTARADDAVPEGTGANGTAEIPFPGLSVDRHLHESDRTVTLARDVLAGLTASPRELPPKWFYDTTGGMLFDKITRLAEYYPTRRERAILVSYADEIATACPADTLIELGSGTSDKTRLLLDALRAAGNLRRFIPFDVDEAALVRAGRGILTTYPGLSVAAVVGDFERHLHQLPRGGHRLLAFLGGTVGNLRPAQRQNLLRTLRGQAESSDALLLGTDLVKDVDRLVAAYDDGAGVTAAFNRNVLTVINRELGGDFDIRGFAHVAIWNAENSWIEMRLRSVREQRVSIATLAVTADFQPGEEILTEISAKFTLDGIASELALAGWAVARQWTDPDGDFAVTLATPSSAPAAVPV